MNILLINPPRLHTIYSEVPTTINAEINTMPPLGLLYLEAYLAHHTTHRARVLDCPARHLDHAAVERLLAESPPDLVGVTGHTHDLMDMLMVTRAVKRICPTAVVWWGGPHVSSFPDDVFAFAEVDGAIPGEGEIPFAGVVEALASGGDLAAVPGILFRRAGDVVRTPPAEAPRDLDALPRPRREVLDVRDYYYVLGHAVTATSLISSRGCPYNCTFCNTPGRQTFRGRSAMSVVDEMEACARLGVAEIYFVDDTFNADARRVQDICEAIVARGLKVRWNFRARINLLRAEQIPLLEKAGCTRIHVGVEAGTDEGMQALRKQLTVAQVREGFRLLKKSRISSVCYFMIGCPHERTRDDVMRTIDFAVALDPDYVLFGIMTPYPDTDAYREGIRRGILDPEHWRRFIRDPQPGFRPQMWTEFLSEADLLALLEVGYKRFYLRPRQVLRKLLEVRNLPDLARKARAGWNIARPWKGSAC